MSARHHVVIVGGGFGGLEATRHLRRTAVDVTLIDRRNFHLFQPLLYQVATGSLSPGEIASPLRAIVKRQRNTRVLLAAVTDVDVEGRRVLCEDCDVPYDTLVVATGARHHYFGHPEWEALAPGLKTIEDATEIRRRVFLAFEAAERETDPERQRAWLTFVIVGAGPTGVELAGALAEIARETLRRDFRTIDPRSARIVLLDAVDRVLPTFPPDLSAKSTAALRRLGVEVRTGCMVAAVDAMGVTFKTASGSERVTARTTLWAAGVQASRLGSVLAARTGATLDRQGRVVVEPDCTVPGHPEIFVIGDLAHHGEPPLPGVAQVAIQQGAYVARVIRERLAGRTLEGFRYRDRGTMATIGRGAAVAQIGRLHLSGYPAWLIWVFVHLVNLVEFDNRLAVLLQWAWNYVTWNRGARLITGESPFPLVGGPASRVPSDAPP
ncbi:MAG TPA: NAD(P)/FAD-dependent oxidoreductase [Candidatus Limnocylindria bacterium]|nr:NAD(P)/FAD-dependent oxidoreductase [Candidatus Limnocylindria bacterium]